MHAHEQKRQYYRLKYPRQARPVVRFADELFHVSEVSEKGIRVVMNRLTALYKGLSMKGTINFHDETNIDVEGAVLRLEDEEFVVYLNQGLTFKQMVEEQRHVRQNYPSFFARLRAA
ncbi:PilZ domain-containing protein [Vibrio maerlii]|uniref:PilZ domain-containing protein n=1 Tax=Vibrio maerlii TaxID=2231648 RepID=UPI000E3E0F95|nr:PilZ domain-containing protein [Vibrio maerlii]